MMGRRREGRRKSFSSVHTLNVEKYIQSLKGTFTLKLHQAAQQEVLHLSGAQIPDLLLSWHNM